MHGWSSRLAIGAFSASLAALAAVVLLLPLRGAEAVAEGVAWWWFLPAFALAEYTVVHVQARRESLSMSLREIPLVIGLVFLAPVPFVLTAVLGCAVALLLRRQSGQKILFNLCLFALEAALAALLYRLALGAADPSSVRGLLAALATIVVVDVMTAAALTVVIWLKVGAFDEGVLSEAVTTGLVAALANSCVGLLVVVLLDSQPAALALLLTVVLTLAVAYRGYSSLSRGHAQLESLYRFTRHLQQQAGATAVTQEVLRQARDVMTAATAELTLLPREGEPQRLSLAGEDIVQAAGELVAWAVPALQGGTVLRRDEHDGLGPQDALAAPLEVDGRVIAVLVVSDRPHHLGPFTEDDRRLFVSLANHAAVSLQKARLLDRLRADADTQEQLSLHDALTGLPNRRLALRALTAELDRTDCTAVLVLDLDGFTGVNEAFGYATGDQLLREVGRRLMTPGALPGHVARVGNDEFAVMLSGVTSTAEAVVAAQDVLATVRAPFTFHALTIDVRAGAGLAVAPEHGRDAELLLQRADAAMYAAKRDRSPLRVWEPETDGASGRRLVLLRHLREAIDAGQLQVHYQPKVQCGTGRVVGAEALARWHHPEHGNVPPDEFVPLAEHSGLIHPLTDHVLDAALAQCALWRLHHPEMTVAVNLSPRSLLGHNLVEQVEAALARSGVPPAALTLELTESAVMTDVARALVVMRDIAALGVRLSIDDFGTGQSSLAYLKSLPVHELKVDRSFITDAVRDQGDAAIVRAAVSLGHTYGLVVVAEGVEDDSTRQLLNAWGCDVVQGYLVSPALSADEFSTWLAARALPAPSVVCDEAS